MTIVIKNEYGNFVGLLDDEQIIVVSVSDKYPKVTMSTTLPTDIEKAKNILLVMRKTIEKAECFSIVQQLQMVTV